MGWWWKSCQHLLLFIGLDKSPLCNLIQFSPQLSVGQSSNHRVTDASIEPESILGCSSWTPQLWSVQSSPPAPRRLVPPACPALQKSSSSCWCLLRAWVVPPHQKPRLGKGRCALDDSGWSTLFPPALSLSFTPLKIIWNHHISDPGEYSLVYALFISWSCRLWEMAGW